MKAKLEELGLNVKIEKKSVDNPSNYVGKANTIIDQNPEFNEEKEVQLESKEDITLYIPDIYDEYPDMVSEGWTLSKVENFATSYGLTLTVKDSSGKTINDYSQYLNKTITNQNRTGKIATGVSFTVTIDADTRTYNLIINYYNLYQYS